MEFLQGKKKEIRPPSILLGKVVANYDEDFKGMVLVAYHLYEEQGNRADWIRVASPMAGKSKGLYMLPEVGDEVVVAFADNDPNSAVVLGSLWNQTDSQPEGAVKEDNSAKLLVTKKGTRLEISEEENKEQIVITTPGGVTIRLTDDGDAIQLQNSDGKNSMEINGENGKITIKSDTALSIESGGEMEFKANQKLTFKAADIQIKSDGGFKAEASGIAELKGSLVKLNG